jgi:anti-sigma factor RsiW
MPDSELHIADDDLDLYLMGRLPAPLNPIVKAHIESCHYCAIRAVEQARVLWRMRESLGGADG